MFPQASTRYRTVRPHAGYHYFDVVDTLAKDFPNFTVCSIWEGAPDARQEAEALCARLNARDACNPAGGRLA